MNGDTNHVLSALSVASFFPSLSLNSSNVPAVMITDDESVSMSMSMSMSICAESVTVPRSPDTDTLLDWTMEIAFDAIEIDTELEKCKHLQIVLITSKKLCQETNEFMNCNKLFPYFHRFNC